MAKTFEFKRSVPVEEPYDLVIAGGGPAGAVAAITAGRLGARVLLIEATGCLGGMGTSGLVTSFNPMANGDRMLVGGVMKEIVETLHARGGISPASPPAHWRRDFMKWIPFRVEDYKLLLDELVTQASVEVRFFTKLIDVDADESAKKINGVILHNIEGYTYVPAKTFLDATGDAVLADLAGVPCREAGRDTPRIMPATLPSLFTNINWEALGKDDKAWHHQNDALKKAIANNELTQLDKQLPGMMQVGKQIGFMNAGHLFNLNALRCADLSSNVMLGRKIAKEYLAFYRKYVPGCEEMEHVTTASLIGIRESRRIVGEYELNVEDYLARRQFPDQIGVFTNFIDIHPYDTSEEQWIAFCDQKSKKRSLQPGESFGIPYGILVPKGWTNFWVAGRCTSSDVEVHGAIRVQPACAMMGQAAATAAVQSMKTGQPANELDTKTLIDALRKQDAYLPQESTSKQMTRA